MEFKLGWYANPIYVNGDYPEIMKTMVAEKSAQQGYNTSRLPTFTEEEKLWIVGEAAFVNLLCFSLPMLTMQIISVYFRPLFRNT